MKKETIINLLAAGSVAAQGFDATNWVGKELDSSFTKESVEQKVNELTTGAKDVEKTLGEKSENLDAEKKKAIDYVVKNVYEADQALNLSFNLNKEEQLMISNEDGKALIDNGPQLRNVIKAASGRHKIGYVNNDERDAVVSTYLGKTPIKDAIMASNNGQLGDLSFENGRIKINGQGVYLSPKADGPNVIRIDGPSIRGFNPASPEVRGANTTELNNAYDVINKYFSQNKLNEEAKADVTNILNIVSGINGLADGKIDEPDAKTINDLFGIKQVATGDSAVDDAINLVVDNSKKYILEVSDKSGFPVEDTIGPEFNKTFNSIIKLNPTNLTIKGFVKDMGSGINNFFYEVHDKNPDFDKAINGEIEPVNQGSVEMDSLANTYTFNISTDGLAYGNVLFLLGAMDNDSNTTYFADSAKMIDDMDPTAKVMYKVGEKVLANIVAKDFPVDSEKGDLLGSGLDSMVIHYEKVQTKNDTVSFSGSKEVDVEQGSSDVDKSYTLEDLTDAPEGTYKMKVTVTDVAGNSYTTDAEEIKIKGDRKLDMLYGYRNDNLVETKLGFEHKNGSYLGAIKFNLQKGPFGAGVKLGLGGSVDRFDGTSGVYDQFSDEKGNNEGSKYDPKVFVEDQKLIVEPGFMVRCFSFDAEISHEFNKNTREKRIGSQDASISEVQELDSKDVSNLGLGYNMNLVDNGNVRLDLRAGYKYSTNDIHEGNLQGDLYIGKAGVSFRGGLNSNREGTYSLDGTFRLKTNKDENNND